MKHSPRSILLIEDDVSHAEITRRNLDEFKDDVRELVHVTDGQAALDLLHELRASDEGRLPDVILLDLRLPKLDGLEFLALVKADDRLRRIPVIVLTTSDAEIDVRVAYDRGANGYLVKPIELERFRELARSFGRYWLQANRYPDA